MGLILSILLMGLVASLSPVTIVVFILVLETHRAGANAPAFLIGWATSLTVVFTLGYLLMYTPADGQPDKIAHVPQLTLAYRR